MESITSADIESAFGDTLSPALRAKVDGLKMRFERLTPAERDAYIINVLEVLMDREVPAAGKHRLPDWERGWKENLDAFVKTRSPDSLIPRYHRKRQLLHWRQDIVRGVSEDLDLILHEVLIDYTFEKYFRTQPAVFEFGCGPAYHLLRLRKYNPNACLFGLDWATPSQRIIEELRARGVEPNIHGHNFNFFEPDYSVEMPPGSGVYTVAALEQVGAAHGAFLQFLIKKRPAICVHLEPIGELLDSTNLPDRLSQLYFRKRNYLQGFLIRLRELQKQGVVTIHREQRTYTGSYFIEGHSMVVWSPN